MDQILSQEEIDALLKGITEGEIPTEETVQKEPEVQPFEFFTKIKTKKEKLPALDFVYDRFSKSLADSLSLFLGKELEISLAQKQYVEYGEFIKTLPLPTNMNIVVTEGLKGFFILIFDAKLVFAILEIIFGSSKVMGARVEGREFTRIEMGVIKRLIEIILSELEKAWAPVYEIKCRYSRSEINPNYVTMISMEETVHLTTFNVEIEDAKGWFQIVVPYGILDTIKEYLISAPAREDMQMRERWFKHLRENVMDVALEVRAVLAKKRIYLQDFLRMKEKGILFLDKHVDDPIEVYVEHKKLLEGNIGTYRGSMAVRIERAVHATKGGSTNGGVFYRKQGHI